MFQRGLVMLGEQFRGVATLTAPLRMIGRFAVSELSGPAPSFEPYALPLRLLRLKNGSLAEQQRFRRVQEMFHKLAPGRAVDLSFTVEHPFSTQNAVLADRTEAEVVITVQVSALAHLVHRLGVGTTDRALWCWDLGGVAACRGARRRC